MATWNSRGLRGSTLEEFINQTNEQYAQMKLALIQKIPTPITPVKIERESRHITLAYFVKSVPLTISAPSREFLFALMRKNVRRIRSPLQMSMSIRLNSCRNLKSRGALLFC